jgi:predicted transposase/invertase (TIGR01784 family)
LKTDSVFYHIFQSSPGILFELLGRSPDLAQAYQFESVEVKQVAFRLDGVFLPKPDALEQTVIFLEVQFQEDPEFYHRFIAEIHLFLKLHPTTVDWMAVVIFPRRSVEPAEFRLFRNLIQSDQVHRIYLEDLSAPSDSVGLGLMQLMVMKPQDAIAQAQRLLRTTQQGVIADPKIQVIIELIETVVVYKFPKLSREEIEKMLGLSELRQTKVYQEALDEGRQEGELNFALRLLTHRFGTIAPNLKAQIRSLSLGQLESLGEALLDFSHPSDLTDWLRSHS